MSLAQKIGSRQSVVSDANRMQKRRLTLSKEMSQRKLSVASSDDMKLSRHSSSKQQNHAKKPPNHDNGQPLSSDSSSSRSEVSIQTKKQWGNFEGPLMIGNNFSQFVNDGDLGNANPIDMSSAMEQSILQVQFIDFEKRWGFHSHIDQQYQNMGDSQALSQSEVFSHHPTLNNKDNPHIRQQKPLDEVTFTQNSESDNDSDSMEKIKKKHEKLMQRNPYSDPYYVKLEPLHGLGRLTYELENYKDGGSLLSFRKSIVYLSILIPIACKAIIENVLFKFFMTVLITLNVILYIYINTTQDDNYAHLETVILSLYFVEIALRIIASGIIIPNKAFFRQVQNIFDSGLVAIFTINILFPSIISIDISPLRMITLLLYLGDIFDSLNVMLTALKQSFKFLLEALAIVGLFSIFFAVVGVSLFQGLFNYRCMPLPGTEVEDEEVWIQCNGDRCPDGFSCQFVDETIKIPTSFNNVIYSYGQVLRTITMDDWSWVMYFTLRIYHPWIWIYYLLIIFIGGFFGFNLVIAVLKTHYAEATEEDRKHKEQIALTQALKKNQEEPERDFINVFDVAMLKFIGVYDCIQKYKALLSSPKPIDEFLIQVPEARESGEKQPRLLSAKQQRDEDEEDSIWNTLKEYCKVISVKNILLPKFIRLHFTQMRLNVRPYAQDSLELEVVQRLKKIEFSSLSPQLNKQNSQFFDSSVDVLLKFDEPEQLKEHEYELQFEKLKKVRLPFEYPELNINHKQKMSKTMQLKMYPFLKTVRLKSELKKRPTLQQFDDDDDRLQPDKRITEKNDMKDLMLASKYTDSEKPFVRKIQNKVYLLIQGYYLDYNGVLEKINTKIPIVRSKEQTVEFKYRQLRLQDLEEKKISNRIWSGNDVFSQLSQQRIKAFTDIIKSFKRTDFNIWRVGIKGQIQLSKKYIKLVVSSKFSQLFFDLMILINFTFLSLMGIADPELISQIEDITACFLTFEMLMRLYSHPLKHFAQNQALIIESMIVTLNFIEFTLGDQMSTLNEQNFRLIRSTKCLLFYRCLKYNNMALTIGNIASTTFSQYICLVFLMFVVIFMYALIGMEMYSSRFDQTNFLGQLHSYDNVLKAFMTIFNIMTNDDWYGVLVLGCDIHLEFAIIYSYSMVIIVNYLTYGLVMAILLDGFGKYLDKQIAGTDEVEEANDSRPQETEQDEFKTIQIQHKQLIQMSNNIIGNQTDTQLETKKQNLISNLIKSIRFIYQDLQRLNPKLYDGIKCQQSLYIFDKSNKLRQILCFIYKTSFYRYLNFIIITFSLVTFGIKTYHDYEEDQEDYPNIMQLLCNIFILLDFVIGTIALGLWMNHGAYVTYTWQVVDLVYIISFFIAYGQEKEDILPIIKLFLYLGYLRAMKFMYMISWLEKIRSALAQSLLDILNVLISLLSVWILFAVFGIILYQNQFGFCEDKMEFGINKIECEDEGRKWINYKHNFDNITIAIPTLFVVSTFDGWGEVLQIAQNSQPQYIGPEAFNSYIHTYIFLIIFCFVGSMFFLSFFTGVLFSNLKANQQKLETGVFTQTQIEFKQITQQIISDFPVYSSPPNDTIRNIASVIINHGKVQGFLYTLLLVDFIILMMFHSQMEENYFHNINNLHHALTCVFFLWVILNFLALGVNRYFDNYWRRYYFFLTFIAVIDFLLDLSIGWVKIYFDSNPFLEGYQFLRLFFMLRNLRIVLIFQGLNNLQRLMRVMVFAIPFLGKIFTILMIAMLIFAQIGCQLFGHLETGAVMDEQINFQNLAQALLTLFKCASGDDWRTIMTDTMYHNPECENDPQYCGSVYNQIYFIFFMLLSNYVLLNLFVLGLIEQFESFFQVQNSLIQTYIENIDKVKTVWCKYSADTEGQSMHYKFLCKFLLDIGQPLGGGPGDNLWDVAKIASGFKLKCDHYGYIQYNQLIYELFRKCFQEAVFKEGSPESIKAIKQYNKEMQLRLMYYRRNRSIPRPNISPSLNLKANFNILHDYLTVLILYKTWESYAKLLVKQVTSRKMNFSENDELSIEDNNQYMEADDILEDNKYQFQKSLTEPQVEEVKKRCHSQGTEDYKFEDIPTYNKSKKQSGSEEWIYYP